MAVDLDLRQKNEFAVTTMKEYLVWQLNKCMELKFYKTFKTAHFLKKAYHQKMWLKYIFIDRIMYNINVTTLYNDFVR